MHRFLLECFSTGLIESQIRLGLGGALNVEGPPTIRVQVTGRSKNPVDPKDLILHLIKKISAQTSKVLEFHASTIASRVSTQRRQREPDQRGDRKRLDQIMIGSCTNGRFDDLAVAEKIMNGAKIAPNMHMLIRQLWPADSRSVTETVA